VHETPTRGVFPKKYIGVGGWENKKRWGVFL